MRLLLLFALFAAVFAQEATTESKGFYGIFMDGVMFLGIAGAAIAGSLFLRQLALTTLGATAKKTENKLDDLLHVLATQVLHYSTCVCAGFVISSKLYYLGFTIDAAAVGALAVTLAFNSVAALEIGLQFFCENMAIGKKKGVQNALYDFLKLARLLLYGGSILFALDNMGLHIASLLGVVGIGGMAVAMGAKDMISDILAAMSLFLDQPFEVGDLISTSGTTGHVEEIGLRSTRVRSLNGELHIFCNSAIAKSKINNLTHSERQNRSIDIGVSCDTGDEQVKALPGILADAVAGIEKCEVDQVYLRELGMYALVFELRYSVLSNSSADARAVVGQINQAVNERLKKENISMPYPTSVVIKKHGDAPPQ
eukprot:TRINITY_DN66980_c7_g5_i1.p1 TRINITY_DN66980_c7_g5~~TRINITY_DN66980_c7_g5_i1.p1  ORF type:complete len:369 (-),score=66.25 TRINITY_DN66980_c7_g5_i1:200-1306(-)